MSYKHVNQLRGIFHDPISANIHSREVESLSSYESQHAQHSGS